MQEEPKFLYRYYQFDEHTERIFTKNEIFFQKPSKFDDPLDSRIRCVGKGTIREKAQFLKRNLPLARPDLTQEDVDRISKDPAAFKQFIDVLCERQDASLDQLGVYCLTTSRDNILMWAHYSDNHKGFCLEFDGQGPFFQRALPIEYSGVLPTFNILDLTLGESQRYASKFAELLLIKAEDWRYQNEWRIVYTPQDGGPGRHTFPEEFLTGVILGFRISNDNRNNIIEWSRRRSFKPRIYQAKPKDDEFGIDIIPI